MHGQIAKISQFTDDTTLILEDTKSLRNALNIMNSFGVLSGLWLNQKKTKALRIRTSSKNKTKPLEFECPKDPIKFLGTYLSHDHAARNHCEDKYAKGLARNQVCAIFNIRDIGKNVLPKFMKLCMETPCLCPFEGHKYGRWKPTKTCFWSFPTVYTSHEVPLLEA